MQPAVKTALENLQGTRDAYRNTIRGMDKDALNWRPGTETNSPAALIVHIVGSQGALISAILRRDFARDRDAEFQATAESDTELLAMLDQQEALLNELAPQITADDLAEIRERTDGRKNTGLYWLFHNLTHQREHLGHLQLTKQMYEQRSAS